MCAAAWAAWTRAVRSQTVPLRVRPLRWRPATGALVVARRQTRPGGQRSGRGKATHVGADLGHQQLGRPFRDPRNRVEQRHDLRCVVSRGACVTNLCVKARNGLLQAIDLSQQFGKDKALMWT
jgi:hypothetical protein